MPLVEPAAGRLASAEVASTFQCRGSRCPPGSPEPRHPGASPPAHRRRCRRWKAGHSSRSRPASPSQAVALVPIGEPPDPMLGPRCPSLPCLCGSQKLQERVFPLLGYRGTVPSYINRIKNSNLVKEQKKFLLMLRMSGD